MEKIRFVKYENIPGHVVGSCEVRVFDTGPIVCGYPGTGDTECGGGIYVYEQKPVQQNVTEQEEQKRVKYVAIVLYDIVGVGSYSKCFDTLEEAEYHLETEYPDPDHISFEIVEMEY